jgi:hypothetical protein
MKRFLLTSLAALIGMALGTAGAARAQNTYPYLPPAYGPGYQTQLSPYLNFLRGGDPAANYFLGVLPEFRDRQFINQTRSQIGGLQILTAPLRTPAEVISEGDIPRSLQASGHPTAFGYTGTFFSGQQQTGFAQPRQQAPVRQYQPLSR